MNSKPWILLIAVALVLGIGSAAQAEDPAGLARQGQALGPDVSTVLREVLASSPAVPRTKADTAVFPAEFRTIDGTGNNLEHPTWGSAGIPFLRLTTVAYENGVDSPAGANRTSAREISNVCVHQEASLTNLVNATDFLWQWGQFIDHDLDLAPIADPAEGYGVDVPLGDPWFDPFSAGGQVIGLNRSGYEMVDGVRQQVNVLTAFIDASMVYGVDEERARALRTLDGTGRLATSAGNLLPFNVQGFPNGPDTRPEFFLAGDERANEQIGLTAMHTLFVREHNFWADAVAAASPALSGDEIYEHARAIVAAEVQAITYREFLPLLLGHRSVAPYRGYRPDVNPGIANVFATAAYRVGHTMLSPILQRVDARGREIPEGHLSLAEAFFRPDRVQEAGIDPILRGLARQRAQEIDSFIVDPVRNFLFGPPGAGGFDLASLNIQRGREHGLPDYNQVRADYGLPKVTSFEQINPVAADVLASVYASVDDVDPWVGGLAEAHLHGALVGRTFHAVLEDQFERVRDGDRFWYEGYLPRQMVELVEQQTLSVIIRRNTGIGSEFQNDAFHMPRISRWHPAAP